MNTTHREEEEMGTEWVQTSLMRIFGLPIKNGEPTDEDWLTKIDATIAQRTHLSPQPDADELPGQLHLF